MTMPPIYRIHPGIGVARLGNSPDSFYIGPQQRAELPTECDALGNPIYSPDGMTVQRVASFKDADGRIRRQAARFEVWVYDDESPGGRPLKRGDRIEGGGNAGALVDIQWRVWLANKKASWYQFKQLSGEHGYASDHPLRNAAITDPKARQRLIIDPGPRSVDGTTRRRASFDRDGGENYSPTFPPPLVPCSIDTLGDLLTDNDGRLLVLGGHGNSGSYLFDEFGQPRINNYANNDGWFDDTSDGPVMARLVMYSELVSAVRFIDVEAPSWVICAYPRFVPEVLDIVTMEDVVDDMAVTQFAERTDIYGKDGTFENPPYIPPTDTDALIHWRAGRHSSRGSTATSGRSSFVPISSPTSATSSGSRITRTTIRLAAHSIRTSSGFRRKSTGRACGSAKRAACSGITTASCSSRRSRRCTWCCRSRSRTS
jgi:hypothetical protein